VSALLEDVRQLLAGWDPPSERQAALRESYLAHLRAHPEGLWREGPPVHLTASCFVLDPLGERTLLTLHRKGGFWVQFGGHLERDDAGLAAAALREGREESGVQSLRWAFGPTPVDLDRHALPARFGRCQEHLDVAFVALAPPDAVPVVSDESDEVAWWPVDALPDTAVADLPARLSRVAQRLRQLAFVSSADSSGTASRPSSSTPSSSTSSAPSASSSSAIADPAAAATPSR
jgi:8-oxo-dGTP pyrophosphatase MutT (NUDIX family)